MKCRPTRRRLVANPQHPRSIDLAKTKSNPVDENLTSFEEPFARDGDLHSIRGIVHHARSCTAGRRLCHQRPGLQGLPHHHLAAFELQTTEHGKARLEDRSEPRSFEGKPRVSKIVADRPEVLPERGRQHEAIVQACPVPHERVGARSHRQHGDNRPNEQRAQRLIPDVRHRLERSKLDQALKTGWRIEVPELVDADLGEVRVARAIGQEIAKEPVEDLTVGGPPYGIGPEARDLELVQSRGQGFIDPRCLRARADVLAREEIRKRRMTLPVPKDAAQQIGALEERVLFERRPAKKDVCPAPRSLDLSVEMEPGCDQAFTLGSGG